eukprot:354926-Chlamydomonas_euryale.AAC.6
MAPKHSSRQVRRRQRHKPCSPTCADRRRQTHGRPEGFFDARGSFSSLPARASPRVTGGEDPPLHPLARREGQHTRGSGGGRGCTIFMRERAIARGRATPRRRLRPARVFSAAAAGASATSLRREGAGKGRLSHRPGVPGDAPQFTQPRVISLPSSAAASAALCGRDRAC